MSDAYAKIYVACWIKEAFYKFKDWVGHLRISEIYPESNLVQIIDEDDDFNPRRISEDEFVARIDNRNVVSFQWWWKKQEDIYCRIRRVSDYSVIEIGLNGHDFYKTKLLLHTLLNLPNTEDREILLGFIFDRQGYTAEGFMSLNIDIDSFITNQASLSLESLKLDETTFNNRSDELTEELINKVFISKKIQGGQFYTIIF